MSAIRNENFIVIQGWMLNNLKLTGTDLIIYAVIYGFTQDNEQWFEGSRSYLACWCNSNKKTVQRNLNKLVENKLILKNEVFVNNVKFCKYKANPDFFPNASNVTPGTFCPRGGHDDTPRDILSPLGTFCPPVGTFCPQGRDILSPNNIDNNIENNIVNNKERNIYKERKNDHLQANGSVSISELIKIMNV